ncbi:MAG: AAA family ATPase [bacterium]|nr:AAA family ATPase [bacterium]
MRKIAAIGRGGVGKTSFIAAAAEILAGEGPLLLIDADPDQSLGEMVGIEPERDGLRTISDILFDIRAGRIDERLGSSALAEKVEILVGRHGLHEGERFDFLAVGTKWTEGCYCQPNNILRGLMARLERNYAHVLIDSPAGLEHLNRRITPSLDDVFAIIGASKKALDSARRARRIIGEIGMRVGRFHLVAGYDYPAAGVPPSVEGFGTAGRLERDGEVARRALEGGTLAGLPAGSPFAASVRRVLAAAGVIPPRRGGGR